eukprot:m.46512 g.46512  ORF g.46512 m.46512 type:complete len:841 (+) comp10380_c0_seq2:71-2593(+)
MNYSLWLCGFCMAMSVTTARSETVNVDFNKLGKRFDGVGGVSGGGGGTRLLYDYEDPQRSDILDFLFKPNFGAALHILKVEIGCDGDTTQGAEQSFKRTADDNASTRFDRGYENWFMVEAKQRNPNVKLSGLEWGVPGWVTQNLSLHSDGLTPAVVSKCDNNNPSQQWTFNYKAPGQLCNNDRKCLNVPNCDQSKPIILFGPSAPGESCVGDCGCTKVSGLKCGVGNNTLDCYKNAQFYANNSYLYNAIGNKCVTTSNNMLVLQDGECEEWSYDATSGHITNVKSGQCMGGSSTPSPPPPPPTHNTPFTQANIDYLIEWVQGLKTYKNLTIDTIGVGYNEGAFNTEWIKEAKKQFVSAGLSDLKTIGTDDCCGGQYHVVPQMIQDKELRDAIDILGGHCTGVQNGQHNPDNTTLSLGKPLWNTEQHFGLPDPSPGTCYDWKTALQLAQTLNQQYVVSNQTAVLMWTPIYSWYDWLPYKGKGLMAALRPWDGTYNVTDTIWVTAHTTQFTSPGWMYLDNNACKMLQNGGSVVTLVDEMSKHFSIIIETVNANNQQTLTFNFNNMETPVTKLNYWVTIEGSVFQQKEALPIVNNMVQLSVMPNSVVTLTTTTGQQKGTAVIPTVQSPFPLPLNENFEQYNEDALARFFSDLHGAFAVHIDTDGNKVLRQQADTIPPLCTHGSGASAYSVGLGDCSMSNYTVSVAVKAESVNSDAFVFVGSHVGTSANPESFYHSPYLKCRSSGVSLLLGMSGTWELTAAGQKGSCATVGKGNGTWANNEWLTVVIKVVIVNNNTYVTASVGNNVLVQDVQVDSNNNEYCGAVILGSGFHHASYDNLTISASI